MLTGSSLQNFETKILFKYLTLVKIL